MRRFLVTYRVQTENNEQRKQSRNTKSDDSMSLAALRAGNRIITFKVAAIRTTIVAKMPRVMTRPEHVTVGAKMGNEKQRHTHPSIVRVAALGVKRHIRLPNSIQPIIL